MADLLGRRRVFMAGFAIFAVASFVGGLASSGETLIAARALQGLGAAILSPAALSLVTTTFEEGAERNKALGVWGAVAAGGGAAGSLLGGVITQSLGWEWVLWINTPIGIAAALLAPPVLAEAASRPVPELRRARRDHRHRRPGRARLRRHRGPRAGSAAVAAALLAAFAVIETRT